MWAWFGLKLVGDGVVRRKLSTVMTQKRREGVLAVLGMGTPGEQARHLRHPRTNRGQA